MATTGVYLNFVPLIMLSTPIVGTTLSLDVGATTGAYVLSFTGATAAAGTTLTLLNSDVPDGVTYTYTGLTTAAGDPIISYPGLLGATNYAALTSSPPVLLSGLSLVSNTSFACFASGTRILTVRGEVMVEELVVGDLVPTLLGRRLAPVRWIGHARVDCRLHPRPWDVLPVRVAAEAFGAGTPLRDVLLSPDHCVHVDGVLIPVRYLVNDSTIVQEDRTDITYWHVELDQHDVVLAEGLPAETYLDTGNRSMFANAGVICLHPEPGTTDREAWAERACAPLVEDGPVLDAVRKRLAAQAVDIGHRLASGLQIALSSPGYFVHVIPPGTTRVELVSRHHVPHGERRRLGASINSLALNGVPVALDRSILASGFHEIEDRGPQLARWTNGTGVLALPPSDREQFLEIGVEMLVRPKLAYAS